MYKVYCDFDETVTERDVGLQVLQHFGTPYSIEIWKEFDSGTRTAAECFQISCSTVKGITAEAFEQLIDAQNIRKGFVEFVQFCESRSIELHIVSDGFSGYIRPILERYNLSHLPVWTNEIELTEAGTLLAKFPHQREGCRRCASCKCALLLTTSADEDTIAYVGDGYSDHCPVHMADIVFARNTLLRQCSEQGIPYHPYQDFHEVQAILENYLRDRPKYRREQAHRRRKELIMIE